jgi:EAL and modified HD-GYP domain-containing signal transduction protein
VLTKPAFWLGRQPILDAMAATVGYELLFRSDPGNAALVEDQRAATAIVINHAFSELGIAAVLGECRGFINFDRELLMSDVVELLPPERTVIELLEGLDPTRAVIERCRDLRSRGFSFALDDVVHLDDIHAPLLSIIDVVKIDVLATPPDKLPELVRKARAAARVKLLAEKVDTRAQADRCRELGFDLFQGYFFARPVLMQGRRTDPSKRVLMRLLEQSLDDDTDTVEIEGTFKQAPDLSYKLMRLVTRWAWACARRSSRCRTRSRSSAGGSSSAGSKCFCSQTRPRPTFRAHCCRWPRREAGSSSCSRTRACATSTCTTARS